MQVNALEDRFGEINKYNSSEDTKLPGLISVYLLKCGDMIKNITCE